MKQLPDEKGYLMLPKREVKYVRVKFRESLASNKLQRMVGAPSALSALLIEEMGFEGVYVSGAVLANDLGLPDIGLTTLTEVKLRAETIAAATNLPTLIDIDTGFGEVLNVARTIREIEQAGLVGCHMEDQVNPKRCGHLDNKQLVSIEDMQRKISVACAAKHDPNFLLMARTDARSVEGFAAAVKRAKAYIEAGAESIFIEALENYEEFARFRDSIQVPLLANMTEFGKSELLTQEQLQKLGYNIVIYPVTLQRLAMKAMRLGLETLLKEGSQKSILNDMQTRAELYTLIRYKDYNALDQSIYNFELGGKHDNNKQNRH